MRGSPTWVICLMGATVLAWTQASAQGYNGGPQGPGGAPGVEAQGAGSAGQDAGGAQGGNPFLGAWTTELPDQTGGTMVITSLYQPDGTLISTVRAGNGALTRIWGPYRYQQVGPNQWRLQVEQLNHLPLQSCAQVAGGGAPTCFALPFTPRQSTDLVLFNGPDAMNVGGTMLQRDPQPVLLQAQVPTVAVHTVAAPPDAAPPVAGAPQTPSGGTRYDSQPAQDFIHQRLKGCSPDPGTLHSYTICDQ